MAQKQKTINIKEIYSQKVFDYIKPSFPTLTDEELGVLDKFNKTLGIK